MNTRRPPSGRRPSNATTRVFSTSKAYPPRRKRWTTSWGELDYYRCDLRINLCCRGLAGGGASGSTSSESEIKAVDELTLSIHLNMALCHIKLNSKDRALDDCNNVRRNYFIPSNPSASPSIYLFFFFKFTTLLKKS